MKLTNLYEKDETAWLDRSVRLIKQHKFDELDYDNLAEFLESMAGRERREVRSRLIQLLKHLLKWEYQPQKRSPSWSNTIDEQRDQLQMSLESRTLRKHAEAILDDSYDRAVVRAARETRLSPATFPKKCPYTVDDLLQDPEEG